MMSQIHLPVHSGNQMLAVKNRLPPAQLNQLVDPARTDFGIERKMQGTPAASQLKVLEFPVGIRWFAMGWMRFAAVTIVSAAKGRAEKIPPQRLQHWGKRSIRLFPGPRGDR